MGERPEDREMRDHFFHAERASRRLRSEVGAYSDYITPIVLRRVCYPPL